MKVVCVVQARVHSSRLHGKVLLPLAGKPMIEHVLERVSRASRIDEVVLAVPSRDVEAFLPFARLASLYAYPLDEGDLVGRHLAAAEAHVADIVVRVPSDNAMPQPDIIDEAVRNYLNVPSVYVSTMYWHLHDRVYADGLGAEVLSLSRLKWLDQATAGQPNYREHPHLLFQDWHLIDGWEQYQRHANYGETIRLDVNTQADYEFIRDIYDALYPTNPNFTIHDILAYLDRKQVTA